VGPPNHIGGIRSDVRDPLLPQTSCVGNARRATDRRAPQACRLAYEIRHRAWCAADRGGGPILIQNNGSLQGSLLGPNVVRRLRARIGTGDYWEGRSSCPDGWARWGDFVVSCFWTSPVRARDRVCERAIGCQVSGRRRDREALRHLPWAMGYAHGTTATPLSGRSAQADLRDDVDGARGWCLWLLARRFRPGVPVRA